MKFSFWIAIRIHQKHSEIFYSITVKHSKNRLLGCSIKTRKCRNRVSDMDCRFAHACTHARTHTHTWIIRRHLLRQSTRFAFCYVLNVVSSWSSCAYVPLPPAAPASTEQPCFTSSDIMRRPDGAWIRTNQFPWQRFASAANMFLLFKSTESLRSI